MLALALPARHSPENKNKKRLRQSHLRTREGIIAAANAGLAVIARHRGSHLLNDNTAVLGPWDHAVDWIAQDWVPRAIAAGFTHFAHVVSPESFAALSAQALASGIAGRFQMRIFGGVPEARAWLRTARPAAKSAA